MFGEMYDADTLQAYGYFNQVVPDDDLLAAAQRLADKVLRQPPLPVESINAMVHALDHSLFHMDDYALALTGRSQDAARAPEAFFQGAAATWQFD